MMELETTNGIVEVELKDHESFSWHLNEARQYNRMDSVVSHIESTRKMMQADGYDLINASVRRSRHRGDVETHETLVYNFAKKGAWKYVD